MNKGVLVRGRQDKDWIAGASPIQFQIRNPSADWTNYLPDKENQFSSKVDTMSCVSQSMTHAVETQIKFLTGHDIDLSERFVAKMSGTTPQGNYQTTVADAIRKYGIPLESDWPIPGDNYTWAEYYAEIPQSVKDKALWLLDVFNFQYEFVDKNNYAEQMKQAPLQAIIEATNPYHAQMLITSTTVFDSYPPYIEPLKTVYDFLKPLLTPNNMSQFKTQNYKGELRIILQASTPEQWQALCAVYGVDPKVITETVS